MSITPFQPTLPPEVQFTDAELNFIEESPPGIFPENQDSNYGLLRKIWTDHVQELINQQITIYNERFVDTSTQFLDEWEKQVGLPQNPSSRSVEQRRQDVLSRLIRGPFTRSRIQAIIENFIIPLFGDAVQLTPAGMPLDAGGTPLFSELQPLPTTYRVYEDQQNFAYEVRVVSTLTPDMVGLLRELKRITPAGITVTVDNTLSNILSYDKEIKNHAPVANYHFETGTPTIDASGFGNTASLNGGLTATGTSLLTNKSGANRALLFDGVNDYFLIPAASQITVGGSFSIIEWVKFTALPSSSNIAVLHYQPGHSFLYVDASGSAILAGTTGYHVWNSVFAAGTAYNISIRVSNNVAELRVNDVLKPLTGILAPMYSPSNSGIYIGGDTVAGHWFSGVVDEYSLYNRALSAAAFSRIYNTGMDIA